MTPQHLTTENELLPCPFCGAVESERDGMKGTEHKEDCYIILMETELPNSPLRIMAWNTRHQPAPKESIIQTWASNLGLRHQGVLVCAIRGCDNVPREDASRILVRMYRGVLLRPHVGDVSKSVSFMKMFNSDAWDSSSSEFYKSIDHYPNNWILHWSHACEITGYKHSDRNIAEAFLRMYYRICNKFHMNPELETELDTRLNADETTFGRSQV